jgi:hypothetical protein
MKNVLTVIFWGGITLIGLMANGYSLSRSLKNPYLTPWKYLINFSLFTVAGIWFTWYLLFGSFWQRYLFPSIFLGGVYIAVLLYNLTDGYNADKIVFHLVYPFRNHKFSIKTIWSGLALVIIGIGLAFSYMTFPKEKLLTEDTSLEQVKSYFDSKVPPSALVESYDSELFFILEQPFHYPPDQAHVVFNRQILLNEERTPIYDPLTSDPDYIIVGRFSEMWQVYDQVIAEGKFKLIKSFPGYEVYERVY